MFHKIQYTGLFINRQYVGTNRFISTPRLNPLRDLHLEPIILRQAQDFLRNSNACRKTDHDYAQVDPEHSRRVNPVVSRESDNEI